MFWSGWFNCAPYWWYTFKKSLFMILLSIGSLSINWKSSKLIYILRNHLYSTKPILDNNFCLNVCKFGGNFDWFSSSSCLISGLCFYIVIMILYIYIYKAFIRMKISWLINEMLYFDRWMILVDYFHFLIGNKHLK